MSLILDTPADRSVLRIATKIRLLRLNYEEKVLTATLQLVNAAGQSLELVYVNIDLADPNLFGQAQTISTVKDLRTVIFAHAQNAGLFGTGVDDNEV